VREQLPNLLLDVFRVAVELVPRVAAVQVVALQEEGRAEAEIIHDRKVAHGEELPVAQTPHQPTRLLARGANVDALLAFGFTNVSLSAVDMDEGGGAWGCDEGRRIGPPPFTEESFTSRDTRRAVVFVLGVVNGQGVHGRLRGSEHVLPKDDGEGSLVQKKIMRP
jgi:hypothetical protein